MIKTVRRYYLLKRLAKRDANESALEATWRAKQEAEPGTALPVGFPYSSRLAAAGYLVAEDIDGADACELRDEVGLSPRESETVINAVSELLAP
jgi:hypothetical protein